MMPERVPGNAGVPPALTSCGPSVRCGPDARVPGRPVLPGRARLAALFGAALVMAVGPGGPRAQVEAPGRFASSPLELIAPGRTLTVIVPDREAESRHEGGDAAAADRFRRALVRRFAERHYLDVDWVEIGDWDALVPSLASGAGDLLAADVTITEPRREKIAFTLPARRTREHLVVRRGDHDRIESVADLAGREIAIRERSSFWQVMQRARRDHPDIEIRLVPENTAPRTLLEGVAEGRLDVAAVDVGDAGRVEGEWPALRAVPRPFGSDAVAWAVRPQAPNLLEALDRFLSVEQLARLARVERRGDLPEIRRRGMLRVITRNNAATFFLWRGEQAGFEYELLREFAKQLGLHVEMVVAPDHETLFEMLARGAGDVAAASLPVDSTRHASDVVMTRPFSYVHDHLVARYDDDGLLGMEDLTGRTVTVRRSSTHWRTLERFRDAGLKLDLDAAPEDAESEMLIAAVGEGRIDLTVAASHVLDLELSYRTDVRKAFTLRGPVPLGWAVRREDTELLAALDEFLDREYRGLFFNVVYQKYFESPARIRRHREQRVDHASAGGLSPYDAIVRREAQAHGFDWPLVVSQMYQESRFNPQARSPAGAVGLMQLLPRTATAFGASDPYDPEQAIRAATAYLAWLHSRLESDLTVKDRMWFALAAYNAGLGRLRDARRLARELDLDPDRWFGNVEKAIGLPSRWAYYRRAAHGYVRGTETVRYVREIRERYRTYLQTAGTRAGTRPEPEEGR